MNNKFMTRLTRLGEKAPESVSPPKVSPIYLSSVFSFDDVETLDDVYEGSKSGYVYSRMSNPGHDSLRELMAGIEETEDAQVYSSGMAAITMSIISQVKSGDHIIAGNVLYGGTLQLFKEELSKFNIEVSFIDLNNDNINEFVKDNTKVMYIETISNPLMEVIDIEKLSNITKKHGIKLIVDNTFATPVLCQPLKFGADISVYSATKYLSGHSDIMGGVVAADKETITKISKTGTIYGPTMSPFDCWLLIRSLRTLELRVKQHSDNAMKLADYLENHGKIEKVFYPGLSSSKSKNIAKKIFNNNMFGGMLSAEIGGGEKGASSFIKNLEAVKFIPSLAGVATSISYPGKTSHRAMTDKEMKECGISMGLLRFSVGLENIDDVIEDFDNALKKV